MVKRMVEIPAAVKRAQPTDLSLFIEDYCVKLMKENDMSYYGLLTYDCLCE